MKKCTFLTFILLLLLYSGFFNRAVCGETDESETLVIRGTVVSVNSEMRELRVRDENGVLYAVTVLSEAVVMVDYEERLFQDVTEGHEVTIFATNKDGRLLTDWIDAETNALFID